MTTIKRATIKTYNASTHKAAVQIDGSLAVWLADVPVATDIAGGEVVAGRDCAVLFFSDDNPDDAVILSVQGAAPATAGQSIRDLDADTEVHTEKNSDEDKIRMTVAGVLRMLLQTTSPQIQLTGNLQFMDNETQVLNQDGVVVAQIAADSWDSAVGIHNVPRLAVNQAFPGGPTARLFITEGDAFGVGVYQLLDFQWASSQSANLADAGGLPALMAAHFGGTHTVPSGKTLGTIAGLAFRYRLAGTGTVSESAPLFFDKASADSATVTEQWAMDIKNWPGGIRQRQTTLRNRIAGNLQLFSDTESFGGGAGVAGIRNAGTVPSSDPTNGGVLYAEAGALKWRGSGGTVTTIAPA